VTGAGDDHGPARPPRVTPGQLLDIWTHDEVRVIARRPHDLEDIPDLALRIRGAFGNALARRGAPIAHRRDPFHRPPPYPALFGDEQGNRVRPFVIDADVVGNVVIVDLRLFGAAAFWADQAREALIEALADGVSLRGGALRTPFVPLDAMMRRCAAPENRARLTEAALVFRTPVCVRRKDALRLDGPSVLKSIVTRVRGLAPWLNIEIAADWTALHRLAETFDYDDGDLTIVRFERYSRRNPGAPIPMRGALGKLVVRGDMAPYHPFLAIGHFIHAGSHAALGFGRYDFAGYAF